MKRCRNCEHFHTIKGCDTWCGKKFQYTSKDGCCSEHKKRWSMSVSSALALIIAIAGLIVSIVNIIQFNG